MRLFRRLQLNFLPHCLAVAFALSECALALDPAVLDSAAFAQSVSGKESPMSEPPQSVVWTEKTQPDWRGAKFGIGRETGLRHLRIGFTKPTAVGSVLVSGGGKLSVLKATAAYPADLNDDAQWLPAERLVNGAPSQAEVAEGDYGLWVLPAGTTTRALRFSHAPAPGDREMAGVLGGVWLVDERLGNVAPQALVQSRARDDVSAKLVDESGNRTWQTWDNGGNGPVVSAEHPEIVTLTWPKAIKLSQVCLLWTGFQACEIDAFTGADDVVATEAPESGWQRVAAAKEMDSLYPMQLGPHWIALDRTVTTRALRLRITSGAKSTHPHLADKVKDGRRVWLGEIMALVPEDGRNTDT